MTIEVKQNLKNSTGTLLVQQIDENFLNFNLEDTNELFAKLLEIQQKPTASYSETTSKLNSVEFVASNTILPT